MPRLLFRDRSLWQAICIMDGGGITQRPRPHRRGRRVPLTLPSWQSAMHLMEALTKLRTPRTVPWRDRMALSASSGRPTLTPSGGGDDAVSSSSRRWNFISAPESLSYGASSSLPVPLDAPLLLRSSASVAGGGDWGDTAAGGETTDTRTTWGRSAVDDAGGGGGDGEDEGVTTTSLTLRGTGEPFTTTDTGADMTGPRCIVLSKGSRLREHNRPQVCRKVQTGICWRAPG